MPERPEAERPQQKTEVVSLDREAAAAQVVAAITAAETALDWTYIRPPQALIHASGIEDRDAAVWAVVAAHWDGVASMIGPGGGGYEALIRLHARLDSEAAAIDEELMESSWRATLAREIADALVREGWGESRGPDAGRQLAGREGGYGPALTLGESLGWPVLHASANDRSRDWRWETVPADASGPDRYRFVMLGRGHPLEHQPDSDLSTFEASATWHEALRSVERLGSSARYRLRSTEEEVVAFRRDVVAGVVRRSS